MEIFAKKKREKGFTLIELLVVIAIIGILAAIVLVSLGGARDKAKDARIITSMSQLRAFSEVHYGAQTPNSYTGFCTATNTVDLLADIALQGGTATTCAAIATDYCVEVQLNNDAFWCVDSALRAKQYSNNPATCVTAAGYSCE